VPLPLGGSGRPAKAGDGGALECVDRARWRPSPPRTGSPAHRESRGGTARFTASLARAGAKRWCQRSSDPAAVPLRSCARAAASDTARGGEGRHRARSTTLHQGW